MNISCTTHGSALHIFNCASHGDVTLLKNYLKERKLHVDLQDSTGSTALILATEYGGTTALKTLIATEADVNIQKAGRRKVTPLIIASENGFVNGIQILTEAGARVDVSTASGETPLGLALTSELGNVDSVKALIRAGANVNQESSNGIPLILAVKGGKIEYVKVLLQAGADLKIRDKRGQTPLIHATLVNSADTCQLLISHKADVNVQDDEGRTVLMYTTNKQCMHVLLHSGANIEISDYSGWTALLHSLKNENSISTAIRNVSTLLEHGAEPVLHSCHRSVLQMYNQVWRLSKYAPDNFTLESAIAHGRRQLARLVICNGVVPQFPETVYGLKHYKSPIGCALHFSSDDIVKYFLANCYLTNVDVEEIHLALLKVALSRVDRGFPIRVHFEDDKELSGEMRTLLHQAMCQPWPLVKLAFIAVSTTLGTSPEREQRIKETRLPPRLQRMLMFQDPISRLPVSEWPNISLCFNPAEYEKLPIPRPLLYYWPFGRNLVI